MAKRKYNRSDLVYSTVHGKMCPTCGKPVAGCECGKKKAIPNAGGTVVIRRETKGRRGKAVTVITGISLDQGGLRELAKRLKQKCGSGGTIKEGVIEIQGDHREAVAEQLRKEGYTAKVSGG